MNLYHLYLISFLHYKTIFFSIIRRPTVGSPVAQAEKRGKLSRTNIYITFHLICSPEGKLSGRVVPFLESGEVLRAHEGGNVGRSPGGELG